MNFKAVFVDGVVRNLGCELVWERQGFYEGRGILHKTDIEKMWGLS